MSSCAIRRAALGCLLAAIVAGAVAAPASAAGLSPAVADCNAHATLTGSYTVSQLRSAVGSMPADVAEYTNCHDVIEHQLLAQLGRLGGRGPGSGGGSFLPTPLIIILIFLGLLGAAFIGLALRQRRAA
jgi:hypothetical protein